MSMSDARQFAELSARVAELENRMGVVVAQIALAQADIHDHVEGKDVSGDVLGPVADPAARDGLRAMLRDRPSQVPEAPSGGAPGGDPAPESRPESKPESDLATDPGLKDRLAALQGGEAAPPRPGAGKR